MIRVNLLKDIGGSAGQVRGGISMETVAGETMTGFGGSQITSDVQNVIKIVILLLPLMAGYGYRMWQEQNFKTELSQKRARLNEIQQKLASYEPALKDLEKFQEEKRKLDSQMSVIKKLMKDRLKPLKALANMQEILPPKLWLKGLSMGGGKFALQGLAMDDSVVTDFVQVLEASVYYMNVKIDEIKKDQFNNEPVKAFSLSGELENPP